LGGGVVAEIVVPANGDSDLLVDVIEKGFYIARRELVTETQES
jgi:hypothetical protein